MARRHACGKFCPDDCASLVQFGKQARVCSLTRKPSSFKPWKLIFEFFEEPEGKVCERESAKMSERPR